MRGERCGTSWRASCNKARPWSWQATPRRSARPSARAWPSWPAGPSASWARRRSSRPGSARGTRSRCACGRSRARPRPRWRRCAGCSGSSRPGRASTRWRRRWGSCASTSRPTSGACPGASPASWPPWRTPSRAGPCARRCSTTWSPRCPSRTPSCRCRGKPAKPPASLSGPRQSILRSRPQGRVIPRARMRRSEGGWLAGRLVELF
mmetsp:Transcript_64455/g.199874  ORF Transcript_64455/g.199874 Transcript_64455/m.199874 type:complete len:207 (-) Transcript_64455:107-727(-)